MSSFFYLLEYKNVVKYTKVCIGVDNMKKIKIILLTIISLFCLSFFIDMNVEAAVSEVRYDSTNGLKVSKGNAICQTDDGFIWLGQYSGLIRYDAKEFETFETVYIEEDGNLKEYSLGNVSRLCQIDNRLFIATDYNLFMYYNYEFTHIDIEDINNEMYLGIQANEDYLYIATNQGLFSYSIINGEIKKLHDGSINDIALIEDRYYYLMASETLSIIYDKDGNEIDTSNEILDIYIAENKLYACHTDGKIIVYDETGETLVKSKEYDVGEHANKVCYYEGVLFVATNTGLYTINLETEEIKLIDNIKTTLNLADITVDYEGNLWVVSRTNGVSMIPDISSINETRLNDILADYSEEEIDLYKRYIYAIEKYKNKIYYATAGGILEYDLSNNKFVLDSHITAQTSGKSVRDLEVFNGKLYATIYQTGLLEYDGTNIVIHGEAELDPLSKTTYSKNVRVLRAFDDYLLISYQGEPGGIIKYQNGVFTNTQYSEPGKVYPLYIYNNNGQILIIDNKKGVYTIDPSLSVDTHKIVAPLDTTGTHTGFLKCMVVDGVLFYNENDKLYYVKDGITTEVEVPNAAGSITEMAYINDKFLIVTETQVFLVNDVFSNPISYKLLDSSDGLKNSIAANTSGYYDANTSLYYFPSSSGIYVFDYNSELEANTVVKIAMKSITVDDEVKYGNNITISKDSGRITFNYSILGFKPSQGYRVYYKLDGFNDDFVLATNDSNTIDYTNLSGGTYTLHIYATDAENQQSNEIVVTIVKEKSIFEQPWFWVFITLTGIAIICAINFGMIHNREKKAEEREKELKEITIESIEAIARTIDAKDTYTNGHSIRVGHFSRIIAQELGMSGDQLENLYYTALLHDIGKIGIPDAILNKPGRLTDEEFDIMKSHTTKGAKILADISTIPNIVEGAKYHHERYGGGGYPDGLKGEDIPYIARIICCADCFDAMATRRVYKDPYPKEKIISEFERCKEIQFDPHMADVVIKLIKEGKLKAEAETELNDRLNKKEEIANGQN